MAPLVKNGEVVSLTNYTDSHHRVFVFYFCEPEDVMGAAKVVGHWIVDLCVEDHLGFYQEVLYRGILQTELVRRWRTSKGILVSNLIFTFGPLHAYHFLAAPRSPAHLWIFAAIFSIGLFFAILFKRSGNLWIVGIMHGLGDWFIDGLTQVSRVTN